MAEAVRRNDRNPAKELFSYQRRRRDVEVVCGFRGHVLSHVVEQDPSLRRRNPGAVISPERPAEAQEAQIETGLENSAPGYRAKHKLATCRRDQGRGSWLSNRSSWRTFRSRTAVVSELVAGGEFILRSSCFATSSNDPFSVLHEFSLCSQPGDATLGERERASIFRGSVSPSNGRWFVHGVRNAYDNEHDPGQDDLKVCGDRLRGSRPLRLRELCANLLLS